MKNKILLFLEKIPSKWHTRKIIERPEFLEYLNLLFPNAPLNLQIWSLINNRSALCKVCSSPVKSLGKETCSSKCRERLKTDTNKHISRVEKQKSTMLEKYGVSNAANIPAAQEKRKSTMLEKYGAFVSPKTREASSSRAAELNKKGKATLYKKYGVGNPSQIPGHGNKCKTTMMENYGVSHYSMIPTHRDRRQQTSFEKWQRFSPNTITFLDVAEDDEKIKIFENPNKLIRFKCNSCNNIDEIPSETFKWRIQHEITPCKNCANLSNKSLKEEQLADFIKSLGYVVELNSKILDGKEIDVLIKDKNIGFEFHGLFWHNDLRVAKDYHFRKYEIAKSKGITLIQVFEDEWDHKNSIVKNRIRHILGISKHKLYARNCKIREISVKQEKEFLNSNHLQGACNSSVKLGAYYGEELVSVMTFSHLSRAKGSSPKPDHWELARFCIKENLAITGIAGKLFKYFVKNYNPAYILSYSDLRWQSNNTYEKIGFKYAGVTRLNYWYINLKECKRIHRYAMRKNEADDQSLTEYENRLAEGYKRIWDCGNSKWAWTS